MFHTALPTRSLSIVRRPTKVGIGALTIAAAGLLLAASPAMADPPGPDVKKLQSKGAIQVDNGWTVVQAKKSEPQLFNADANPGFVMSTGIKLTHPAAPSGDGRLTATGLVFGPCPNGQNKCQASEGGTTSGIGLAFGDFQATPGNALLGGFVNDDNAQAQITTPDELRGTITALAVGGAGAFAVGQDTSPDGFNQAIVWQLDSTGQSYDPVGKTFLPPLKGKTSIANGISLGGVWVAGAAPQAVYAHTGDTAWTDLSPFIPKTIDGHKVTGSEALIANDDGIIAGTVTTKQNVLDRTNANVDYGFVFNVNTSAITFFSVPGANVIPLKVLPASEGSVVIANAEFIKAASAPKVQLPSVHPIMFDGSTVTDFFASATGEFAFDFGCQIGSPNNLGEVVGTCIPDQFTPYDSPTTGIPFYLNMLSGTPTFLNLGDTIHANEDASIPGINGYRFSVGTAIDDQDEVLVDGATLINGKISEASFLVRKNAYNPNLSD